MNRGQLRSHVITTATLKIYKAGSETQRMVQHHYYHRSNRKYSKQALLLYKVQKEFGIYMRPQGSMALTF